MTTPDPQNPHVLPLPEDSTERRKRYVDVHEQRREQLALMTAQVAAMRGNFSGTVPCRVLIVDDQKPHAHLLSIHLAHYMPECELRCSYDAEEALELARSGEWAVLTDLALGHHTITGITIAQETPRTQPVFLLSGVAPEKLEEVARHTSAVGWAAKPLTRDDVLRIVEAFRPHLPAPSARATS